MAYPMRTNDYRWRKQQLEKLPPVAERWNIFSQDENEQLPIAHWFDVQVRVIPNHPDLPPHLHHVQPAPPSAALRIVLRTQRIKRRENKRRLFMLHCRRLFHMSCTPTRISILIILKTRVLDNLLPTHVTNVASRTTYAPTNIKQAVLVIQDLSTDLHEHAHTIHGIKDLVLAKICDVHVLALKKLVQHENIDHDFFSEAKSIYYLSTQMGSFVRSKPFATVVT